jgi:hypothetical protein
MKLCMKNRLKIALWDPNCGLNKVKVGRFYYTHKNCHQNRHFLTITLNFSTIAVGH